MKLLSSFKGMLVRSCLRAISAAFVRTEKNSWAQRRMAPVLAGLYYLVEGSFLWEQRAVLRARLHHWQASETALYSYRRNLHRLEKGMIMKPRRPNFAEGYIGETIDLFRRLLNDYGTGKHHCTRDLQWGHRTFSEYFSLVADSEPIRAARSAFESIAVPEELRGLSGSSVCHPETASAPFGVQDLLQVARTRHSIRWFLPTPVPREAIDAAVTVALQSPNACNRQAYSFRIFDEPELTRQVAGIPMGISGFEDKIPCLAVLIGHSGAYPEARDRHLIYIDASLAAMAFILAMHVQGIGTCCVNWPEIGELEERMQRVMGLTHDERPIMLISIGYPDPEGEAPSSPRRSLEEMRFYNKARGPFQSAGSDAQREA